MKQIIKYVVIYFFIFMGFRSYAVVKKDCSFSLPKKAMTIERFRHTIAYAIDNKIFVLNLKNKDSYILEFDKDVDSFYFGYDMNLIEVIFFDNGMRQKLVYNIKNQQLLPDPIGQKGLSQHCEGTILVLATNNDGSRHAGILLKNKIVLFESGDIKSVQVKDLNDDFWDCCFNDKNEIELIAFDLQTKVKIGDAIEPEVDSQCKNNNELFELVHILGTKDYIANKITQTLPKDELKDILFYKVSLDMRFVALLFKHGRVVLYDKNFKKKIYEYQDSVEQIDFLTSSDGKNTYFFVRVKKDEKEAVVLKNLDEVQKKESFSFKISYCKKYITFIFGDGSIKVFDLLFRKEIPVLDFLIGKKNVDEMNFFKDSYGQTKYLMFSFNGKPCFVLDCCTYMGFKIGYYLVSKDKKYLACSGENTQTLQDLFLFDVQLRKRICFDLADKKDLFYKKYQSFKFFCPLFAQKQYALVLFHGGDHAVIDAAKGKILSENNFYASPDGNHYLLHFYPEEKKDNLVAQKDPRNSYDFLNDFGEFNNCEVFETKPYYLEICDKNFKGVFESARLVKNYAFFKSVKDGKETYVYIWISFADGSQILWSIAERKAIPVAHSDYSRCGNHIVVSLSNKELLLLNFKKREVILVSVSGKINDFLFYTSGDYFTEQGSKNYLLVEKKEYMTVVDLNNNNAEHIKCKKISKFEQYFILHLLDGTLMVLDRQQEKMIINAKQAVNYKLFKNGDNCYLCVSYLAGMEKIYDLDDEKELFCSSALSYRLKCDEHMNHLAEGVKEADDLYRINVWKVSREEKRDFIDQGVKIVYEKEKVLELESKYKLGFDFSQIPGRECYLRLYSRDKNLDFTKNKNIQFVKRWAPCFVDIDESAFPNTNKNIICAKFKKRFDKKYVKGKKKADSGYLIKLDHVEQPKERKRKLETRQSAADHESALDFEDCTKLKRRKTK